MHSSPILIKKSPSVIFEEILYQERNDLLAKSLRSLLYPFSLLYGACVKCRNTLYDTKIWKETAVPACVISVGNVILGGSGKTPFILMLAKRLQKHFPIAILTRGYLSAAEHQRPVRVNPGMAAQSVGDEALLMATHLPDVLVYAGKDRVESAKMAVRAGAKVILLDDGMQHRKLKRDFEIVIKRPLKCERYLPGGMLRDDPSRIKSADLIVSSSALAENELEVRTIFKDCAFVSGEKKESFGRCKVALFCGLGSPSRFLKSVQDASFEVVTATFLGDHKAISHGHLKQLSAEGKKRGAEFILCTEKDWMKLRGLSLEAIELPLAWVRVECEITKNEKALDALIEKVMRKVL